ncbi:MAG: hypothetical protein RMI34_01225 [Chloroherpetonaceae bacterium]|nr:hypothetical protein [Chloroherpetonaceae bacterium]MDW8018680.1 hypothetical protein [Chloroherpetonaceae bacterium]
MGLGTWIKGLASAISSAGAAAKAVAKHMSATADVVIPEKACNLFLEAITKRDSPIQKPHIVIHDKWFELKFFHVQPPAPALFCVLPLHIAELVINSEYHYAVIERAGKLSIVSGSVWQSIPNKLWQAYLNSSRGERRILKAIADSVEFIDFLPAFRLCGNELRPASLRLNLTEVFKQHHVTALMMEHGITDIVGISSLTEEEGQFVLNLRLGSKVVDKPRGTDRLFERFQY